MGQESENPASPVSDEEDVVDGEDATAGSVDEDLPTIPFTDALEREGVDATGVGSDVEVWDHPTVTAVLADVRDYFETHEDEEFAEPPTAEFIATDFFDFSYLDYYEEVSRTWVNKPFAYISILYDDEENEHHYHVSDPTLDGFERYVRQDLVDLLRDNLMYKDFTDSGEREEVFREEARTLIADHGATVRSGTLHKLLYYLMRDFVHYGSIDPIMRDPNIEDVSCDGADVPIFVYHREYRDLKSNVKFDDDRLSAFVFRLAQRAGKQLTVSNPLVDASLPNGSRVQLTLGGDVATRGPNFTIRKFADIPYTPVDLIEWNTFSVDQMAYFWLAIENNKSLIFAGGTGSGKTSSMNAVSFFIPPSSKIVSIEDTREIDLPHENWIQSVTRGGISADGRGEVAMYDLLQAALRQRPEYMLVGEIRTQERVALSFFQAMSTGHTAYTTVHADSVRAAINRLKNPPLNVPIQMLQELDIISIQGQTFLGEQRVRRNRVVAEIETGTDDVEIHEIFKRDAASDDHERVGESRVMSEIADERGWSDEELRQELDNRREILTYLADNDMTDYDVVARTIHLYSRNPDRLMDRVHGDGLTREDLAAQTPDIEELTPTDLGVSESFMGQ